MGRLIRAGQRAVGRRLLLSRHVFLVWVPFMIIGRGIAVLPDTILDCEPGGARLFGFACWISYILDMGTKIVVNHLNPASCCEKQVWP